MPALSGRQGRRGVPFASDCRESAARARPLVRGGGKLPSGRRAPVPGTLLEAASDMRVGDLMQRDPKWLDVGATLDVADEVMRLGRIRHLPVVAGHEVVGVLTQRDLFRAGLSSLLQAGRTTEHDWLAAVPVRAVMTPYAVTATPETSMRRAVMTMLEHRIGCLPVVEDGRLVGLLCETDCLRYLTHVLDLAETRVTLPALLEVD